MMYDIDCEHSVKTIHENPGKGYSSTPVASTIDTQRKSKSNEDVNDDYSKEISDLSNMSKLPIGCSALQAR